MSEILKLIAIGVLAFFSLIFLVQIFQKEDNIEGLENKDTKPKPSDGAAGNATTFADNIKANVIKLQDELLISKYRSDYENIIVNMDDYINLLTLKQIANIDLSNSQKSLQSIYGLSMLKNSKDTLNDTMKYMDTQ